MAICFVIGMATDAYFMFRHDPSASIPGQPLSSVIIIFEFIAVGSLMLFSLIRIEPILESSAKSGFFGYGAAAYVGIVTGVLMGGILAFLFVVMVGADMSDADETFQGFLLVLLAAAHGAIVYGLPSAVLTWSGLSKAFPDIEKAALGKLARYRGLLVLFPFLLLLAWQVVFWPLFYEIIG